MCTEDRPGPQQLRAVIDALADLTDRDARDKGTALALEACMLVFDVWTEAYGAGVAAARAMVAAQVARAAADAAEAEHRAACLAHDAALEHCLLAMTPGVRH